MKAEFRSKVIERATSDERSVSNLRVRPMTEDDLSQVMEIEFASFPMPWSPLAFALEIRSNPHAFYLVLESGESDCSEIIVYLGLWQYEEKAWVTRIATAPSHARKGWATCILSEAEEFARQQGSRVIMLEVRRSNEEALSFYSTNGYFQTEILRDYYDAPREDALILAKNLDSFEDTRR